VSTSPLGRTRFSKLKNGYNNIIKRTFGGCGVDGKDARPFRRIRCTTVADGVQRVHCRVIVHSSNSKEVAIGIPNLSNRVDAVGGRVDSIKLVAEVVHIGCVQPDGITCSNACKQQENLLPHICSANLWPTLRMLRRITKVTGTTICPSEVSQVAELQLGLNKGRFHS
jgi:hypothetical protein